MDLAGNAFVQTLQSESVTLKIGKNLDEIVVPKALLAKKSDNFAKLLSKQGLSELQLPEVGERILPPHDPGDKHRKEWKELMIDTWIFGHNFDIAELQNDALEQLISHAIFGRPTMLDKVDITYIWERLGDQGGKLKNLIVIVLVAQLELPGAAKTIEQFADLAALRGFMTRMYKSLKMWEEFEVPKKQVKKKWRLLLESETVVSAINVVVKERVPVVMAKRPAPVPFLPGEVIELD
ncbi:hypothetical protein LTR10_003641 [Elasticomyces elasticus]|nr:hypothetical protein LTR10_003641 [Elasticomyces elasticus]KAK4978167.1 hypothetical protein LTR42_002544 [Elasticomyces elasticus]